MVEGERVYAHEYAVVVCPTPIATRKRSILKVASTSSRKEYDKYEWATTFCVQHLQEGYFEHHRPAPNKCEKDYVVASVNTEVSV
jgi:hypothetical protein